VEHTLEENVVRPQKCLLSLFPPNFFLHAPGLRVLFFYCDFFRVSEEFPDHLYNWR